MRCILFFHSTASVAHELQLDSLDVVMELYVPPCVSMSFCLTTAHMLECVRIIKCIVTIIYGLWSVNNSLTFDLVSLGLSPVQPARINHAHSCLHLSVSYASLLRSWNWNSFMMVNARYTFLWTEQMVFSVGRLFGLNMPDTLTLGSYTD